MIPDDPSLDELRRDPLPLRGRAAVVTGVSRRAGIGYAVARRLAALGASLFLHHYAPHDRDQPWGEDPGGTAAVLAGVRAPWPAPAPGSTISSSTWPAGVPPTGSSAAAAAAAGTWTSWSATTLAAAATGRSARLDAACSTRTGPSTPARRSCWPRPSPPGTTAGPAAG